MARARSLLRSRRRQFSSFVSHIKTTIPAFVGACFEPEGRPVQSSPAVPCRFFNPGSLGGATGVYPTAPVVLPVLSGTYQIRSASSLLGCSGYPGICRVGIRSPLPHLASRPRYKKKKTTQIYRKQHLGQNAWIGRVADPSILRAWGSTRGTHRRKMAPMLSTDSQLYLGLISPLQSRWSCLRRRRPRVGDRARSKIFAGEDPANIETPARGTATTSR